MRPAGRWIAVLCGLAICGMAGADEDDPDAVLLEYLGSWGGQDEQWHEFFESIPAELIEAADEDDTQDGSTERDSD